MEQYQISALCAVLVFCMYLYCRQRALGHELRDEAIVNLCKKAVRKFMTQEDIRGTVPELIMPKKLAFSWDCRCSTLFFCDCVTDPLYFQNDFRLISEIFPGTPSEIELYAIFRILPTDGKWVAEVWYNIKGRFYFSKSIDIDKQMKLYNDFETRDILKLAGPRPNLEARLLQKIE